MFSTVSVMWRENCATSPDKKVKKEMLFQKTGSLGEKRFRNKYHHIFKSYPKNEYKNNTVRYILYCVL